MTCAQRLGKPKSPFESTPMQLARVDSLALLGLNAIAVRIEVQIARGLPAFHLVGLPAALVRESRERVRAAMTQSGFVFARQRLTVNLAPADLPKDSNGFELPIALGIRVASQQLPASAIEGIVFLGELSLGGKLQAVRAAFALGLGFARNLEQQGQVAQSQSRPILCVPPASAADCAMAYDGPVWQVPDLRVLFESLIDEQARPSLAYACVADSKSEPLASPMICARCHTGSHGLKGQSTCQICSLCGCKRRTSPLAGWAPRLWKKHAGSDDGIDPASAKRNHPA